MGRGLACRVMSVTTILASVLDSLQDVSSVVFAVLAFAGVFLLLKGLERV
jgi:hypothetical protein